MQRIIPTGCGSLDEQLRGGLPEANVVLVYGEAETGKTTLAIQCAVNCARMGYKTIFVDCDGTFFPRRMVQIAAEDFENVGSQIVLIKPEDFEQQAVVLDRLSEYVGGKVRLIVVDTITGLYSERLGNDVMRTFALNRELNRQMACLAQITKTQKVVSLVASQVRSMVSEEHVVQPVATRVLKFWADMTISLKPTAKARIIKATVESRTARKPSRIISLKIEGEGLRDYRR